MAWNEIRVENWLDIVRLFDQFDYGRPSEPAHFYRGQSNAAWPLVDKLSRLIGPLALPLEARHVERTAFFSFRAQAHLFLDRLALPAD